MKKIISRLSVLLLLLSACNIEGADVTVHEFNVARRDWAWNSAYHRYECLFDSREIDTHMYNKGLVTAGVYITETDDAGNYTVLKPLPYVFSYTDGSRIYTETISFDISDGAIGFFIQQSDLSSTGRYLQNYTFRVTMID